MKRIAEAHGVEHILGREPLGHPNAQHSDDIVDLSWRHSGAFERIAIVFGQVWRNSVVQGEWLIEAVRESRSRESLHCKSEPTRTTRDLLDTPTSCVESPASSAEAILRTPGANAELERGEASHSLAHNYRRRSPRASNA